MQFELKSGCISLAYVFSKMESALQELPIEEYSVCQNTLDNVSLLIEFYVKRLILIC